MITAYAQEAVHRTRITAVNMNFGKWVEQVLGAGFTVGPLGAWSPSVDVYEDDANYYFVVDLAGVCPEEVELNVREGALLLSGGRPSPGVKSPEGPVRVLAMEIDHGRFQRKLPVPGDVDGEKIDAEYRNGLLWVQLPKKV